MNIEELKIKIVYALFISTVVLSILIALYQYIKEKKRIYLFSLLYWISILSSSIVNVLVADNESHFYFYLLSVTATFISQSILAYVMTEIRELTFNPKISILFFLTLSLLSVLLKYLNFPFEVVIYSTLVGALFPIAQAFYLVIKNKKSNLTSAQLLFYLSSLTLTLHYLDYPYFKTHKDLFAYASVFAFLLIHVLSVLMPMVANELDLFLKNKNLELEIQKRLAEIRKKDQQVQESEKLASIGRISGLLAHELNTPLASISAATTLILKYCSAHQLENTAITTNSNLIKLVVKKITTLTELFRTAAGDQIGLNPSRINLKLLLADTLPIMAEMAQKYNVKLDFKNCTRDCFVTINEAEMIRAIRTAIWYTIELLKNTQEAQIEMTLEHSDINSQIIVKSSPTNFKQENNQDISSTTSEQTIDLHLAIVKAILEAHNGSLEISKMKNHTSLILILKSD